MTQGKDTCEHKESKVEREGQQAKEEERRKKFYNWEKKIFPEK